MKHKRIMLGAAVGVLIVVALAGAAVAVTDNGSSVPAADHAPVASGAVDSALAASVSALAGDTVALSGRYDYVQLARHGGNLAAARKARTTSSGGTVYWVPSDDGACLTSSPLLETGCFTGAELTDGVTASSVICAPELPSGTIEVYGTAPDGIATVRIAREDDSSVGVAVVGNVYVYTAPIADPRPLSVEWTQNGASHGVDASVPHDFRDGTCVRPQDLPGASPAPASSSAGAAPTTRSAQDLERELHSR